MASRGSRGNRLAMAMAACTSATSRALEASATAFWWVGITSVEAGP